MEPRDDDVILGLLATDLNQHYALLWQKYGGILYSYVFRQTSNLHDTDDIMQDTALRAYNALSGYSADRIRSMTTWLRPWLYKVAKSAYLTHVDKQKRFVSVSLDAEIETLIDDERLSSVEQPEHILEGKETRDQLARLVVALPEKYREVICLHYFDGFKLHEIADILQEPAGTIRQRERRALALLHKAIEKEQNEV